MKYDFKNIIKAFQFCGDFIYIESYGHGHINDTYAVYFKHEFSYPTRYILQRINHRVFQNPACIMENISGITKHIAGKVADDGEDPRRHVLTIVKSCVDEDYYVDTDGNYWRAYNFIDNATSYQKATPELFMQTGAAFGRFSCMLSDYPAQTLHESIPNFHNTRMRFEALKNAVAQDAVARISSARREINFALERERDAGVLVDMLANGELPLRVTHNDTKLNNVMIDNDTGKGICVIDLDTVMPGLSPYDFGDSIRFGANTGAEDEPDLSKVSLSLELFEAYSRGYLSHARESITSSELKILPFASTLMTLECGVRFLTDYLIGDSYFKTSRPNHNLDRCRTQFKLVSDMENKLDSMTEIITKYSMP